MTDQTIEVKTNTLTDLAKIRKLAADQQEAVKKLQSYLEETPAYKNLAEAKAALTEYSAKETEITASIKSEKASFIAELIDGMDKDKRAAALAEFKKALPDGLALRVTHSLKYDEQEAIRWCQENAKTAIKTVLDKKPFEALAETTDLAFVEKIDTPTITIASDLSMYLQ